MAQHQPAERFQVIRPQVSVTITYKTYSYPSFMKLFTANGQKVI